MIWDKGRSELSEYLSSFTGGHCLVSLYSGPNEMVHESPAYLAPSPDA